MDRNKSEYIVRRIREFNRFYTVLIGTLNRQYLQSAYSLTETRILYELFTRRACTANELVETLRIDKSYMSRIIKSFERGGLVTKELSAEDMRSNIIRLTGKGLSEIEAMQRASDTQISGLVAHLDAEQRREICDAMDTITEHLSDGNFSPNHKA